MSTKRILSLVLALVMVLGTFGTVFAATGNEKIDWLVDQGIVTGNESGDLMLDKTIDRASVAKMVVEALDQKTVAEGMKSYKTPFADVPVNHWSNGNINVVSGLGLMIGNGGKFMPSSTISYAEVVTILVRMLDGEQENAVWPTTYIAKAHELGILADVSVANFSANAVRKDILEMFYNAMINREVGNYTVVKGIVLENNRVETLDKDQVVVEILRVEQIANYAKESRLEKGDQKSFTIDAKVADVENLLGQVANFTINKDGKVVKVTADTSYKVVEGTLDATKNKVTINGTTSYTVELDERYKGTDERIFRTYHNDKAYAYEDFYKDVKAADYARVTTKNGKVLLINAFTFEDVAPVKEVKKDGQEVYIYNDQRDARVEKYAPVASVISYTEGGKLNRIDRSDIKANDVVHVYRTNRMIVRQDALVDGTYEKVSEGTRGNFFVHVDGEKYYMNDVNYKRPVYSFDSKEFTTLYANRASSDLNGFRNEEVTVLLDINGDLQYIGAGIEFNEGIAIISDILSRGEVRFVKPNNDKFELTETYDSDLVIGGTTKNQRMSAFNRGDLVFVVNDENNIDTMNRLATAAQIKADADLNLVKKNDVTKFEMNNDYIRLDNGTRYQLLSKTNVFRMEFNANGTVKAITGTTVEAVRSGAKKGIDLKAYVLTDADFDAIDVGNRSRTSGRNDVAHTIVFVDYQGATASYNYETIRVTRLHTASSTVRWIEGVTASGETLNLDVHRTTGLTGIDVDDIVELGISKDDDKVVMTVEELIAYNAGTFRVVDMDSRTDYRWIKLEDAAGKKVELWVSNSVEEFGTPAINDVVTFHKNAAGDIDVIRSYSRTTKVTGLFEGSNLPEEKVLLNNVYKLAGQLWVRIDGVDYKYVGLETEDALKALVGKEVVFNTLKVNNETVVDEIVELVPAP